MEKEIDFVTQYFIISAEYRKWIHSDMIFHHHEDPAVLITNFPFKGEVAEKNIEEYHNEFNIEYKSTDEALDTIEHVLNPLNEITRKITEDKSNRLFGNHLLNYYSKGFETGPIIKEDITYEGHGHITGYKGNEKPYEQSFKLNAKTAPIEITRKEEVEDEEIKTKFYLELTAELDLKVKTKLIRQPDDTEYTINNEKRKGSEDKIIKTKSEQKSTTEPDIKEIDDDRAYLKSMKYNSTANAYMDIKCQYNRLIDVLEEMRDNKEIDHKQFNNYKQSLQKNDKQLIIFEAEYDNISEKSEEMAKIIKYLNKNNIKYNIHEKNEFLSTYEI